MSSVFVLMHREVQDMVRDWRLSLPALLFTSAIPMFTLAALPAIQLASSDIENPLLNINTLYPVAVLVVTFFPCALTVVISLESFVGERERGTLESLLLSPISDQVFYLGKLLSCLTPPFCLGLLSMSAFVALGAVIFGQTISFSTAALILSLVLLKAVVLVSGAAVISSQSRTVRAANFTATIIVFPVTLLLGFESHFLMHKKIYVLYLLAAVLLIYAVIFIRTGFRIFNRENLMLQDPQIMKLSDLRLMFAQAFYDRKKGFLKRLTGLVVENRRHLASVGVLFMASVLFGFFYASSWMEKLPQSLFPVFSRSVPVDTLGGVSPFWIFLHNIRAVLVLFAGTFLTFGGTGLALVMLPGAIIGFLVGFQPDHSAGMIFYLLSFLFPHGFFELPAALLSSALIFKIGSVWMVGGEEGWAKATLQAVADFVFAFTILIPLFGISAYLEVAFH